MKILEIGDLHLSLKKPANRLDDDYIGTILGKLDQIHQIAIQKKCDIIVQVGDFFDTSVICDRLKTILIEKLKDWIKPIYAIYGQHDISGHNASTFERSPLRVLAAAGCLTILGKSPRTFQSCPVALYGASFGQDVPDPQVEEEFNVLVIHDMIGDKPLFPGHELTRPKSFLKQHPKYDLVLVGDYHYSFQQEYRGRWMLNAGAVIRKTISERDQKLIPSVKIFDTESKQIETVALKVAPVDSILNIKASQKEKNKNQELENFIKSLQEEGAGKNVNWESLLLQIYKEKETSTEVRQIIDNTVCKIRGDI